MKKQCPKCGQMYSEDYMEGPISQMMKGKGVCFTCAFWYTLVKEHGKNPLWCRIEGASYIPKSILEDGQKSKREWGKGFSGAEFHIEMDDGTKFRTDDLWMQGAMPGWMKELYPDNAKFSTDARYSWNRNRGV